MDTLPLQETLKCTARTSRSHKFGKCNAPLAYTKHLIAVVCRVYNTMHYVLLFTQDEEGKTARNGRERVAFVNMLIPGAVVQKRATRVQSKMPLLGHQVVSDVSCAQCGNQVGWKCVSEEGYGWNAHRIGRYGLHVGAFLDASLDEDADVYYWKGKLQYIGGDDSESD